jgi:uncharacterized membrane protein HdeD (DUF308 family)
METNIFKNWWFLALNGVIAIMIGILFLFYSDEIMETIMQIFAFVVLALGVIEMITGFIRSKKTRNVMGNFILAIAYIALALFIFLFHDLALKFLFILLGVWAVIIGIFQLFLIVYSKSTNVNKNITLVNGLLTILVGVVLIVKHALIGQALGLFILLFGVILIYLAFVLRGAGRVKPGE